MQRLKTFPKVSNPTSYDEKSYWEESKTRNSNIVVFMPPSESGFVEEDKPELEPKEIEGAASCQGSK